MPRDAMITAIDLRNCLQRGQSQPGGLFIITSFNKLDIAFHVDSVVGIHRVSWREIIKPGRRYLRRRMGYRRVLSNLMTG